MPNDCLSGDKGVTELCEYRPDKKREEELAFLLFAIGLYTRSCEACRVLAAIIAGKRVNGHNLIGLTDCLCVHVCCKHTLLIFLLLVQKLLLKMNYEQN